ncbi:DUF6308 family protein [Streptomyces sp. IBSBF 3136]|uniref:DUF6308 family protein n=1 Tax=Streptomyces sp. IBSBF 3136 TaxID=2903524 RepID=UPI003FA7E044
MSWPRKPPGVVAPSPTLTCRPLLAHCRVLFAGKRPRLLPVCDRMVRCALGRPRPPFWLALHAALREDNGAVHRQLHELRQVTGVPETVSALRVCDVAVWRGHRDTGHACPR